MVYLFNPCRPCCAPSECGCTINVPILSIDPEYSGVYQALDLSPYVADLRTAAPACRPLSSILIWRLRIIGPEFPAVSAIGAVHREGRILIAERSHSLFGWRPWTNGSQFTFETLYPNHTGLHRDGASYYLIDHFGRDTALADEVLLDIGCVDCAAETVEWPGSDLEPMKPEEFAAAAFAGESALDPTSQNILVTESDEIEPDTDLIGTPEIDHDPFCVVDTLVWDPNERWSFNGIYYDAGFSAASGRATGGAANQDELALDGHPHTVISRRQKIPTSARLLHLFGYDNAVGGQLDAPRPESKMTQSQIDELAAWLRLGNRMLVLHTSFVIDPFVGGFTRHVADLTTTTATQHPLAEGVTGFPFLGSVETDSGFINGRPDLADFDHRGISLADAQPVMLDNRGIPIVSVRDYGPEPSSKILVGSHRVMLGQLLKNCIDKLGTF